MSAANKEEFAAVYRNFIGSDVGEKPILLEVFTDHDEESEALKLIRNIWKRNFKQRAKAAIKENVSPSTISRVKKLLGR